MVEPIKGPNPNPVPQHGYQIGGIQVAFPYKPYGTQLAFMSRVIQTLDRALKDGHSHALLESPTGTGKSLSLLCSVLAWQQNYISNNLSDKLPNSKALTDPLSYGGGFVPEAEPSGVSKNGNLDQVQSASKARNQKKKSAPIVYYATRTHSQVSQVIREYRRTSYRVPMALLASRKHYCTNPCVRGKDNIDEECKVLLKNGGEGCVEFKNAHKVKYHPSLQKGGCHEVHDIEDLVKVGQTVKGCSYYAARSMADDAQLVFCPYSYVINPVIRGAMEIDIKGAIIVFDEAHNIEDIARDSGSVDVEEDILLKLQTEIGQLCMNDPGIYQPLYEMIQDLISWMDRRKSTLEKRGFQNHVATWTGDMALKQLQDANISQQSFPILLECATKAIRAASDTEEEVPHLSGLSVLTLEGLFSSLTYFFSRNGSHVSDYQLVLQKHVKRDEKNTFGNWTYLLSLWCLNPAVVFKDIADLSLSIILTSGTLSPTKSFSSELGVQFGTYLEAPHVIDVESQVWATVISSGPGNYPLNASYKTADSFTFQDTLGKCLEEIFNVTPGGSLVFFPSYKLMEKLCNRWQETGQWSTLNARKSLFVEPRGGQEELEPVLKSYYDAISGVRKPTMRSKKTFKKTKAKEVSKSSKVDKEGAAFLAVCRGKVSEGIDFSDDNARVVILVGIPFPNINDSQVALKKKYNDSYKASKALLSGSEWYCHQAFRALNQAVGRCIRHKDDHGAIILLDERFLEERNKLYISKWLRKSVRQYENFDQSLEGLRSFFRDVKYKVEERRAKRLPEPDKVNCCTTNVNGFTQEGSLRIKQCEYEEMFSARHFCSPQVKPQADDTFHVPLQAKQESKGCKEQSDPKYRVPKESWSSRSISLASSDSDEVPDTLVEEPPTENVISAASPASLYKEENCDSATIEASVESPDRYSFDLICPVNQVSSRDRPILIVTPEKAIMSNTHNVMQETESSFNWSTSSFHGRKRKPETVNLVDTGELGTHNAQTPPSTSSVSKSMEYRDTTRRIEFGLEAKYGAEGSNKLNTPGSCTTTCSGPASRMDTSLQISCSLCKTPLGVPKHNLYVRCSRTSSSKVHLLHLSKKRSKDISSSPLTSVPVIVTDSSSVDKRLCNRSTQGAEGQGVWSSEDGCVFNNIFCPFCTAPNNCLGVEILATDAANVRLLNKILFYVDRLEIKNQETKQENAAKDQGVMQVNGICVDKMAKFKSIEKFAYSHQQKGVGGLRNTKSKVRRHREAWVENLNL